MGAWRPKHVEWLCRNKICTVLHQVGVSFDLYYDARKHKIKKKKYSEKFWRFELRHNNIPPLPPSAYAVVSKWHGTLTPFTLSFIAEDQKKEFGAPMNSDLWHVPFQTTFLRKCNCSSFTLLWKRWRSALIITPAISTTPYSDHYKKLPYLSQAISFAPYTNTP